MVFEVVSMLISFLGGAFVGGFVIGVLLYMSRNQPPQRPQPAFLRRYNIAPYITGTVVGGVVVIPIRIALSFLFGPLDIWEHVFGLGWIGGGVMLGRIVALRWKVK
jgi:MFS family permease